MSLIWVDLETTGLNTSKDSIIEFSVFVAPFNDPTNAVHVFTNVLAPHNDPYRDWDPVVLKMHKNSGLLKECMDRSKVTTLDALRNRFVKLLVDEWAGKEKPYLAGSSIHFDRAMLEKHIPRALDFLHHRNFDVSSIKLDAMSLGMPEIKKAEAHRSKDDILESIRHLAETRSWLRKFYRGESDFMH